MHRSTLKLIGVINVDPAAGGRYFFSFPKRSDGFGTNIAYYSMGTGSSFPGGKTTEPCI
jgi:hypothetical protein